MALGWIIEPDVNLDHFDTHFDEAGPEYYWAAYRFCEKYAEEIRNKEPLCLGYLFHLWMDIAVMTDFVSRVPMSQLIEHRLEVREMKWKDMGKFIKGHCYTLSDENFDEILKRSKVIEEIDLTRDDLVKVRASVNSAASEFEGEEYSIYTPEALAEFYEKNCRDFIGWFKNF